MLLPHSLNDIDVKFQLDTAADVNTICQKRIRQHQVSPTTAHLNMWNKTNLKPLGETRLKVKNPHTSSESEIKFGPKWFYKSVRSEHYSGTWFYNHK